MTSGVFPSLGSTPAMRYSDEKALTATRYRTVYVIEELLDENEGFFQQLLRADEDLVTANTSAWAVSSLDEKKKAPREIGNHGLLAFPGVYLEGGGEIAKDASVARFLIKAIYSDDSVIKCGSVFHLSAKLGQDGKVLWGWQSFETMSDALKKECLNFLLRCVRDLVELSIPRLLRTIRGY